MENGFWQILDFLLLPILLLALLAPFIILGVVINSVNKRKVQAVGTQSQWSPLHDSLGQTSVRTLESQSEYRWYQYSLVRNNVPGVRLHRVRIPRRENYDPTFWVLECVWGGPNISICSRQRDELGPIDDPWSTRKEATRPEIAAIVVNPVFLERYQLNVGSPACAQMFDSWVTNELSEIPFIELRTIGNQLFFIIPESPSTHQMFAFAERAGAVLQTLVQRAEILQRTR